MKYKWPKIKYEKLGIKHIKASTANISPILNHSLCRLAPNLETNWMQNPIMIDNYILMMIKQLTYK